jgi:hypothetical protein
VRIDAFIDRKQMRCPNASTIGYGKWKAQTGDIVVYRANEGMTQVGRVIGRITHAPALDGDKSPTRNYLLLAVLNSSLTFVMERWINPEDVIEVFEPREDVAKMLAFFFSPEFTKESVDTLRRWTGSGFATPKDNEEYMARIRGEVK